MVCVPCIFIPVLLFIWHRFIQPYVLRWWNPWAKKGESADAPTEFPFNCKGGACPFPSKTPAVEDKDKPDTELERETVVSGKAKAE